MSNDRNSILDRLCLILDSIKQIETYSQGINSPNDFLTTPEGVLRLDGCVMRFQVIGETVRSLLEIEDGPLSNNTAVPWKQIIGLRNIISHEYMSVDEGYIFEIIRNDLSPLKKVIEEIQANY